MTKSKYILFILLISINSFGIAQTEVSFDEEIATLNSLGRQIIGSETDEAKYDANKKHTTVLKELISNNTSFDYNFDSLKTISVLKENNLKIYNWALPLTDGTFEYFAFLQIRISKEEYDIVELIDKSENMKSPETRVLTPKNWYGALYYKIIYNKKLGKDAYTLLGWDGNNLLTNKKIIDVVNITNTRAIKFGNPSFKMEKKTKKRVIFEYSADVVMSLKYHANEEKIVFDYLVPASSKLKGVYEYYGPHLKRFDALILDKNRWSYEENTQITLDRNIKDSFWEDPTK